MRRPTSPVIVAIRLHPAILAGSLLLGIALTGAVLFETGVIQVAPASWPLPPPRPAGFRLPAPAAVPATAPAIGTPAPAFALPPLGGGDPAPLSRWRGRPVVLYFWTSWCAHCRQGLPVLQELAGSADRLAIVGINILEPGATVQAQVQRSGITFPVLLDQDGAVSRAYGVGAVPAVFFLDAAGNVQSRLIGHDARRLVELASRLLQSPSSASKR